MIKKNWKSDIYISIPIDNTFNFEKILVSHLIKCILFFINGSIHNLISTIILQNY